MTTASYRLKLVRTNALKLKVATRIPARIEVESPILLDTTGGIYNFSLDVTALETSLQAWLISLVGMTQRVVIAAGAVAVTAADVDTIVIAKTVGAATTVNLPTAASRVTSGPYGRTAIRIADGKYDAATNNITIVPNGSEKIMGGASYIIDSNGASITLTPLADGSGWI